jgi:hypothetical protein
VIDRQVASGASVASHASRQQYQSVCFQWFNENSAGVKKSLEFLSSQWHNGLNDQVIDHLVRCQAMVEGPTERLERRKGHAYSDFEIPTALVHPHCRFGLDDSACRLRSGNARNHSRTGPRRFWGSRPGRRRK